MKMIAEVFDFSTNNKILQEEYIKMLASENKTTAYLKLQRK